MKKLITYLSILITLLVLTACSGSNAIVGDWKAQAPDGSNRTIQISKKEIIVDGIADSYKQYGLGFENGISYYSLKVEPEEGTQRQITVVFPDKDKNVALIMIPEDSDEPLKGTLLYAMNKEEQPDYQEYVRKYLEP